MGPQVIHLPDGQNFTVTPVFSGLFFKSHELNTHPNAFPIGWSVVLTTQDEDTKAGEPGAATAGEDDAVSNLAARTSRIQVHSYRKPTRQGDNLFISSISNPSSSEFKPAASPTRQIAMMLWVTLYWYFHQPEPDPWLHSEELAKMPDHAKPRGEWRINIKRDGILRSRNLIPKLERMGLIASRDPAVGADYENSGEGWDEMFVSRQMFWQIPGSLFLFTLQPKGHAPSYPGSPVTSRPGSPFGGQSPNRLGDRRSHSPITSTPRLEDVPGGAIPTTLVSAPSFPIGPYFSSSHLPTYYPPKPLQYTLTNRIRHPLRPKPPRMGEVFYTRYVPSMGQYLGFRVASLSPHPVPYMGPMSQSPPPNTNHLMEMTDSQLIESWLAKPRVSAFWGGYAPHFLETATKSKHSFPVIGLWDGVPFGYFEIYWVKEDILGQHLGAEANDWDRGLHILVGEEWARGRVPIWLGSLVHWCLTADYRTMNICMEPRVDNLRCLQQVQYTGFSKERQISFPHKQAWFCRIRREAWEGPTL